MLDDSKHVLARHRRNRLSWNMRVVPGENPARSDKLTLAGLGLQATDTPQVIQIRGEQWRMRTCFDGWSRKPFERDSACKLDRRPCSYTGSFCRMVINKPIDHRLMNWHCSTGARHKSAESPEPTEIGLGRRALVIELREIRRYAVHLAAQPSAAKPANYIWMLEKQLQHRTLSSTGMTGTPWPSGESEEDIMWRLSPPIAAKSRTTRRRRHIITSDTYMRIAMQRLLNLQRQAVHATPHIRRARGQPDPNTG